MTRKFLYINGIAILFVILFHSAGWGFTAMFSWAHRYLPLNADPYNQIGSFTYYILRFIEQMAVVSIPAFLFVSGFFVAFSTPKKQQTIPWSTVIVRVKTLLIPYFVWTFVILLMNALQGRIPSFGEFIVNILTGSTTPAYYFVILLIQMYLVSPFLVPIAKKHAKTLIIITLGLQIVLYLLQYIVIIDPNGETSRNLLHLFPKWFFLVRIFWFSLGMVIGFHRDWLKRILNIPTIGWISITLGLFILGFIEWEWMLRLSNLPWIEHRDTLVDGFYSFAFLATVLSLNDRHLFQKKRFEFIGGLSFGIYLAHIPVMEIVSRGIYHLMPSLLNNTFIFVLLVAVSGLLIPILIMEFVRRTSLRRIYAIAFG